MKSVSYDLAIIIPTLNESENISEIIFRIDTILRTNNIKGQILVVDDSSSDDTQEQVLNLIKEKVTVNKLSLISRQSEKDLSQSVIEGILASDADIAIVTDADMSHDINKIPDMYHRMKTGADVVIGSRYMAGGEIRDWPFFRRVVSRGANSFARFFFPSLTDPGSGFFAIRKNVILTGPRNQQNMRFVVKPIGFRILFEILSKGEYNQVVEMPYTFTDRKKGKSKLRGNILKYIFQLVGIFSYSFENRNNLPWIEIKKCSMFALVGMSGLLVNMSILYTLTEYFDFFYLYAGVVAIVVSISTNFFLNDIWTFGGQVKKVKFHGRFVSYFCIALFGMALNLGVLWLLTSKFNIYYIYSNFIGIMIVFLWNFIMNRRITFIE